MAETLFLKVRPRKPCQPAFLTCWSQSLSFLSVRHTGLMTFPFLQTSLKWQISSTKLTKLEVGSKSQASWQLNPSQKSPPLTNVSVQWSTRQCNLTLVTSDKEQKGGDVLAIPGCRGYKLFQECSSHLWFETIWYNCYSWPRNSPCCNVV